MNRFEKAVYECMQPTAELLDRTTSPLQRAILLNLWRHVHLEGAGEFDRIVAPDMMVDHPVYRVTWGANPTVIEGKEGVLAFYNRSAKRCCGTPTTGSRSVTGASATRSLSTNWPAARTSRPSATRSRRPDALYHVSSRQAFIWPYDEHARLAGEHLYEDKTSLQIEEVDPSEAITPARVREIHREQLAKLEAERGENFWVLHDA